MKVIVVGKGGREHALVTALAESESSPEVYCYPGSDAIFDLAKELPGEISGVDSLVDAMVNEGIDFCVGGEESWLAKGLADRAREKGIPTWGPVSESAQLEASKEFAKEFMFRHNIPTGGYEVANDYESAMSAIKKYPTVLKFDGLAAGKGVAICSDQSEAESFLKEVYVDRRFGDGRVLIEEFLEGPEVSVIAAVSDGQYQIFTPARDYKRLADGDEGLNTGGMGAVASRVLIDKDLLSLIDREVMKASVDGLVSDGMDFRGFLYAGLMLTDEGPKLLEYNCRFGDPEAQAVLPLVGGDFSSYLFEAAKGNLQDDLISFDESWSICLVLASAGYPDSSRNDDLINGLDSVEGVRVYHAGTKKNEDGQYVTNGGRVLAVVGRGDDRESAVKNSYNEAAKVSFDGNQRRSDIGRMHFE
ncbi:MAG: phosphoribosylamine--glycine ligase [Verrucomicrobiota bacterium]|nr:phosphoribosylamine--glycine ligase [Verrucomicrobiota bacterium]MED5470796.1 phosphoribosylamine--glycine ligase [Verrucomicrobiota bacterium]